MRINSLEIQYHQHDHIYDIFIMCLMLIVYNQYMYVLHVISTDGKHVFLHIKKIGYHLFVVLLFANIRKTRKCKDKYNDVSDKETKYCSDDMFCQEHQFGMNEPSDRNKGEKEIKILRILKVPHLFTLPVKLITTTKNNIQDTTVMTINKQNWIIVMIEKFVVTSPDHQIYVLILVLLNNFILKFV